MKEKHQAREREKNTSSDTCQIPTGYHEKSPPPMGDVLKCPKKAKENFLLILCPPNTLHKYHARFLGDEYGW
jgi:hypothetical protein